MNVPVKPSSDWGSMSDITEHPKWRDNKIYGHDLQKMTYNWKKKHEAADEIIFHKDGTLMMAVYISPCGKHHDWLKELFKQIRSRMDSSDVSD